MKYTYPTKLVQKLTGVTNNQLKYWVKIGIVRPIKVGKAYFYSFKDIVKLQLLVSLKGNGLSLQKARKGINNLSEILSNDEEPLSRLIIHTDGVDMIVAEKGRYFSAITRQHYFRLDTEEISSEIIRLHGARRPLEKVEYSLNT